MKEQHHERTQKDHLTKPKQLVISIPKLDSPISSFHPQINPQSKQIVTEKRKIEPKKDVFEDLYQKALNKTHIQYQPSLDEKDMSQKLKTVMLNKSPTSTQNELTQFLDRQETHNNDIKIKKQFIQFFQNNFDTKTGQRLFTPKLNLKKKQKKQLNTTDFLSSPPKQEENQQEDKYFFKTEQKDHIKPEEFSPLKSMINNKSQKIIEISRQKKIDEIFKILDSKNTGIIDKSNLNWSGIQDPQLLQIISPLLIQIEQEYLQLTYSQFCELFEKHIKSMDYYDRLKLFSTKSASNQFNGEQQSQSKNQQEYQQKFEFKPYINEKSRLIDKLQNQIIHECQNGCVYCENHQMKKKVAEILNGYTNILVQKQPEAQKDH